MRRRGDECGRRDGHRGTLRRRRSGLHGFARREPAGEQFTFGGARLRASRGGKNSFQSVAKIDENSAVAIRQRDERGRTGRRLAQLG